MYLGALYCAEYAPEGAAVITPPTPAADVSTTRGQGYASRQTLPYRGPRSVVRYENGVPVEELTQVEEFGAPQREAPKRPARVSRETPPKPSQPVKAGREVIGSLSPVPVLPEIPAIPAEPALGRQARERKRREIQAFNAAILARIVGEIGDF